MRKCSSEHTKKEQKFHTKDNIEACDFGQCHGQEKVVPWSQKSESFRINEACKVRHGK